MIFDVKNDSTLNETYKLMAQTIIPRPIAWVVTEDNSIINIAPFSFFMGLSSDPATVMISVGHKDNGKPKDTLENIRKNKICTICMVEEKSLEKMHFSSKSLDKQESEAEVFDIETTKIFDNFPPMIANVPCTYFCSLRQEIDLGGKTVPLILNVEKIYIADKNIIDKQRLTVDFKPVARIGKSYAYLSEEIKPPKIP